MFRNRRHVRPSPMTEEFSSYSFSHNVYCVQQNTFRQGNHVAPPSCDSNHPSHQRRHFSEFSNSKFWRILRKDTLPESKQFHTRPVSEQCRGPKSLQERGGALPPCQPVFCPHSDPSRPTPPWADQHSRPQAGDNVK